MDHLTPEIVLAKLADHNIKAIKFGTQEIRFVTHLDFDDLMLEKTVSVINKLSF
jgi:threonine aldolase